MSDKSKVPKVVPKVVRLALSEEEIVAMLRLVAPETTQFSVNAESRFRRLYRFLAELAQAPIYREECQIQVGNQELTAEVSDETHGPLRGV